MKMQNKFLLGRVARRIFALFVLCALVPMAALTTLSFHQVYTQLHSQNQNQLQAATKSVSSAIYERLTILDFDLQALALRTRHELSLPSSSHFRMLAKWEFPPQAPAFTSTFGEPQQDHLLAGRSVLTTAPCTSSPASDCILLVRMIDTSRPDWGWLAGEINPFYLWSADRVPGDMDLCVLGPRQEVLFNSGPEQPPLNSIQLRHSPSGFFSWQVSATLYDAAYRDLFLKPSFQAETWSVILSEKHDEAYYPLRRFRQTLFLVMLLALWTILLLSLVQIRRTTGPLEKLAEGTHQITEQNFDARVNIASGDEFQDLAASFNSMSSQLGRQFRTLQSINEIDQAILSSLNRKSVISTALSRMIDLVPAPCLAIAIFEMQFSDAAAVELTLRYRPSASLKSFAARIVDAELLHSFTQNQTFQLSLDSDTPAFLESLRDLGMVSAQVFPIPLDHKPFAALICGLPTPMALSAEEAHRAAQFADRLAVAFSNIRLVEALEQLNWGTLTALARAIDAKSTWTAGHSERVTHLALKIGAAMGLPQSDLQIIHRGGLLHDIGKIGTPPEVLDKPGKLEPQELQTMRDHVRVGVRILEPIAAFADALPVVAQHHEWVNGAGYPEGLTRDQISIHARILAVADCYDAIASDRPYRKGLPPAKVIEILEKGSGTQFDPAVIQCFLALCAKGESLHPTLENAAVAVQST